MAIEFTCPVCGETLRVDGASVGQVVRCGGCMTMLRVPDADGASSDARASSFPDAPSAFPGSEPPPPPPPPPRNPEPIPYATPEPPRTRPSDPDEPPRPPRRRRVRRESPPTGRSPLFWIVITLGVLGVGSCVFCCGIAVLFPQQWKTLDSKKGGFKVEVPASPKNMTPRTFKPDKSFALEGTRVFGSNEEFVVMYKEITRNANDTDEKLLENAVKDLKKGVRPFGDDRSAGKDGFAGRELLFRDNQNNTCIAQVILADTRLYVLVVGSPNDMTSVNARRFFDSFQITDEKLLAKRQERRPKQPPADDGGDKADQAAEPPPKPPVKNKRLEEERSRTQQLGVELGKVGFPILARDIETRRHEAEEALERGTAAATAAFQRLAAEQERARFADLGMALAKPIFETVDRERERALEETRSHDLGVEIGKTAAIAIDEVLDKK